jgi:hypothetical protein
MLYLYGDESNNPGVDRLWAIGFLFTSKPTIHMRNIQNLRKENGYYFRELKYSSTDYSQLLFGIRIIDYFLTTEDLYFKIIIKEAKSIHNSLLKKEFLNLGENERAYISAYSELCKSIKPSKFLQDQKLVNIDEKGFKGNTIFPNYLKNQDKTIINVYRRNSKVRTKNGLFTGISNMIQLTDFLTGIILSLVDSERVNSNSEKHKNIYRKAIISKCKKMKKKMDSQEHCYWPSSKNRKLFIFRPKKNALLDKSPSRS